MYKQGGVKGFVEGVVNGQVSWNLHLPRRLNDAAIIELPSLLLALENYRCQEASDYFYLDRWKRNFYSQTLF